MTKTIDYYYTHASPWTYLGTERFFKIAEAAGAEINFRPASLHVIFPQSGGLPLAKRAPQRQAYRMMELKRWHDYLGIPINFEPAFFPVNDEQSVLMVIAAQLQGSDIGQLTYAMSRAVWVEDRDVSDEDAIVAVADEQGFDGKALLAASKEAGPKEALAAYTEEAMERQVFGAPTYIYKDELFWGQDRLDFLERALARG
jgi:2-hydroxychromene-2-carboxylate isomerase